MEREKNRFADELIEKEKTLNSKLADRIQPLFSQVQMVKKAIHEELIDFKMVF